MSHASLCFPRTLSYWESLGMAASPSPPQYFCFLSLRQSSLAFLHTTVAWDCGRHARYHCWMCLPSMCLAHPSLPLVVRVAGKRCAQHSHQHVNIFMATRINATPTNSPSPVPSAAGDLFAESCFRASPRMQPRSQELEESIITSPGAAAFPGNKRTRSPSPQRPRSPALNVSNIVQETAPQQMHNAVVEDSFPPGASIASDDPDDAPGVCPDDAIPVDWLPGVFIRFLPPPRLPSPPRIISPPPNSEWRSPSPPRRVNHWSCFHHRN